MRLAVVSVLLLGACAPQARWHEPQSPSPDWYGDPLTTESSTVDDVHGSGKRTVCHIRSVRPADPDSQRPPFEALRDRLKLCRDKGFEAVTVESPTPDLHRAAAEFSLPVLSAPTDLLHPASTAPRQRPE